MKKTILYAFLTAAVYLGTVSCERTDIIGGSVNNTDSLNISTFELLASNEETAVVAELFQKAGLVEEINGDVTVISPNKWSVNRYIRRKNSVNYKPAADPDFTIESMTAEDLAQMGMYIFPGKWWRNTIPDEGIYLTSTDGKQDILLTLDATNTDPGAAYDGGGAPGYGYQYSNFMMSRPYMIHVLFKRGVKWEMTYQERSNLGMDHVECDQYYRMYVSDIRTLNGVVHVLYMGDASFSEHYYYHTLFFFGTRADDV